MSCYYNENDPYAAQWLRNLIAAGHIAAGDVDERSIVDVKPDEVRGYRQCHFFAGIGGWSYALRLAGWPDDRAVWTGSCPCQPFSIAGKRKGAGDKRHLWPDFFRLISECRPAVVFGEQVAGHDGAQWLTGIRVDLESAGYACGAANLCAAAKGAPHQRARHYWVANTDREGRDARDAVTTQVGQGNPVVTSDHRSFFENFTPIEGDDGSVRRVDASVLTVASGISWRVGALRAAGNAIVPQVAATFIRAVMP